MIKKRLITVLYNAITLLEEYLPPKRIKAELGLTDKEYTYILCS